MENLFQITLGILFVCLLLLSIKLLIISFNMFLSIFPKFNNLREKIYKIIYQNFYKEAELSIKAIISCLNDFDINSIEIENLKKEILKSYNISIKINYDSIIATLNKNTNVYIQKPYYTSSRKIISQSNPIIINVSNYKNAKVVKDIILFDSFNNSDSKFEDDGSLICKNTNVKFSSLKPQINYKQYLEYFKSHKLKVGLVCITSKEKINIEKSFRIQQPTINCEINEKTYLPLIDPYQFQDKIIVQNFKDGEFTIDGLTKFIIEELAPNSDLTIQIYPKP